MCIRDRAGYIPVACFCIPENCWIEHFYMPQVEAQEDFLRKYKDNQAAEELIAKDVYKRQTQEEGRDKDYLSDNEHFVNACCAI